MSKKAKGIPSANSLFRPSTPEEERFHRLETQLQHIVDRLPPFTYTVERPKYALFKRHGAYTGRNLDPVATAFTLWGLRRKVDRYYVRSLVKLSVTR